MCDNFAGNTSTEDIASYDDNGGMRHLNVLS